jgi:hypothetical protein
MLDMRSHAPFAALLVLALIAGCTTPGATDAPADDAAPRSPPRGPDGSSGPGALTAWPAADSASIRPGVQVVSDTGQCTSNFVFTSLDNASVYLGLAAHCVEGLDIGAPLDINHGAATGTLAYSSWQTMADVAETDGAALEYNDFALVLIPNEARGLVSPAMRHFGGPIGLAESAGVASGDKVLTYGNSGLRQEIDPASWHEGYVLERAAWTSTVATVTPGVPGDSGSGVLTGDGRALGILVTLTVAPLAGTNGVTHLDQALAYASEHAGIDVVLATWELEDPGFLP